MTREARDSALANDLAEFATRLANLKAAKRLTFVQIQNKSREKEYGIASSTAENLTKGKTLPRMDTVIGFLDGCGVPRSEQLRWLDSLRALTTRGLRGSANTLNRMDASRDGVPPSLSPPLGRLEVRRPLRGRDGLILELSNVIDGGTDAPRVQVLYGLGGSGKTSIALAVAAHALERGITVWWTSAADPSEFMAAMNTLIDEVIGSTRNVGGNAADRLWLQLRDRTEPWMLVVDGVDRTSVLESGSGGSFRDGTGWVRPAVGRGFVLLSTRDSGGWMPWCQPRRVEVLDVRSAGQVLLDHAAGAGTREDADLLADRLGGLPLALRLAGSYLASTAARPFSDDTAITTFTSYLHILNAPPQAPEVDDARQALWRVGELSLKLLTSRELPGARPLLRLLSEFADADVPIALLLDHEILARWTSWQDVSRETLTRTLQGLQELCLVDFTTPPRVANSTMLTIHPLVRDAARWDRDGRFPPDSVFQIAAELAARAAASTGDPEEPANWAGWEALVPHLFHLAMETLRRDAPHPRQAEGLWSAAVSASVSLVARGFYGAARTFHDGFTQRLSEAAGPQHPVTVMARGVQVQALHLGGQLDEAETRCRSLLESARRTLDASGPELLEIRHRLARILHARGNLESAEQELRTVLILVCEAFGEVDPAALTIRHNLAGVLQARGRLDEAGREFATTLALSTAVHGVDHPHTLATQHEIARILLARGDFAAARRSFEPIYAARVRILGERHPDTLTTYHALAVTLAGLGRSSEAEAELEQVFALRREVLGDDNPHTLTTGHKLAQIRLANGDAAGAVELYRWVLEARTRVLGRHHDHTLLTQHKLRKAARAAICAPREHGQRQIRAALASNEESQRL